LGDKRKNGPEEISSETAKITVKKKGGRLGAAPAKVVNEWKRLMTLRIILLRKKKKKAINQKKEVGRLKWGARGSNTRKETKPMGLKGTTEI